MTDLVIIKEAVAREVDESLKKFREAYALQKEENVAMKNEILLLRADVRFLTQKYAEIKFREPL
jgi:hypothetical protein